ncbi:hypothetical protein LTR17_005473 [Elasticomyces elasticus]|nr:hypothetical protein LTR17_005473 [Elasticomyces elasticus]
MPTITNRLAYAVKVDAAHLVTHIEAEAQLYPVTETLRLCHVFGTGDDAHITRLPKELVDMIEDELVAESVSIRARRQEAASKMSDCFGQNCSPLRDHASKETQLAIVNEAFTRWGEPTVDSLLDDRVDSAKEHICDNRLDWEEDFWQEHHSSEIEEWQKLVGKLGVKEHGLFTKHQDFVRKRYGLEVFVAHRHDGERVWYDGYKGIYTTLAYVVLPSGNAPPRSLCDCNLLVKAMPEDHYPAEDACISSITVPSAPSQEEKQRVSKMLNSLGLPGWQLGKSDEEDKKQRAQQYKRMSTMPTITTRLAYALQVDAADFVACLEVNASFRDTRATLRLCNVFGAGDQAHITRLPKELIDEIDGYLEEEQPVSAAQRRAEVKQLYECFQNRCRPCVHLDEDAKRVYVRRVVGDKVAFEDLDDDAVLAMIEEHCNVDPDDWKEAHDRNIMEWQNLVGKPGSRHNGDLHPELRTYSKEQYDLDVIVVHQRSDRCIYKTHLYLTLNLSEDDPTAGVDTHKFRKDTRKPGTAYVRGIDCEESPCRLGGKDCRTEDAFAREVIIPEEPSEEKKALFLDILMCIGMPGWEARTADDTGELLERATPKLMMLTRVNVGRCHREHQDDESTNGPSDLEDWGDLEK